VWSSGFPANLTIDKRYFASRQLCGDGEIKAHIASLTGGGWAGLTLRDGAGAGVKMVALKIQQGSTMMIRESRAVANGIKQMQSYPQPQQPLWLKITRSGNVFSFYSSTNGSAWQLVGTTNIPMSNCIQAGLFTESINNTAITTGKFDQVQIIGSQALGMEEHGFEIQEEQTAAPTVLLFPNPAREVVQVQLEGLEAGSIMLQVWDQAGRLVMHQNINYEAGITEQLSVQELPSGLYLLKATASGGEQITAKLMVQH